MFRAACTTATKLNTVVGSPDLRVHRAGASLRLPGSCASEQVACGISFTG